MSLKSAVYGLFFALKTEINMKLLLICTFVVFALALFFQVSSSELLIILVTVMLVFLAEMVNSSIEAVCDLVTQEWRENVKIAKDIAAGSVLVASFFAFLIGLVIFLPKVVIFLKLV